MSIFSQKEIDQRMETLRSKLGDNDAGVFFSFTNSYYMSGVPILPWGRPAITIVPKNNDPVIISGKADEQNIANNSPIKNVITYGDTEGPNVETALSHLSDVIQKYGFKKVGFDGRYTPFTSIEMIKVKQPDCHFEDITDIVEKMRLVNSNEEVDLIRIATAIADVGMNTFLSEAKLGMTEIELAGRASLAMSEFVAKHYKDHDVKMNCYSQQGNSTDVHAASGGNPLTPGQLMVVVVEASVSHYMSSVERAIGLGDLSPEQQHYFDAIVTALQKTIEACVPGVPCSKIDQISQNVFRKAGYDNFLCGTGLARGLINPFEGRLEHSHLRVYNHRPLRPNMVLSVEPYAVAPGVGAQRHCEMVLITDTGNEVLSKAPNGYLKIGNY